MTKTTRGVEQSESTDMALIGDTAQPLHTQALPKRTGPNFGYGTPAKSDEFRVEGNGEKY